MAWVYDTDTGGRWMVFDDALPDNAPVVCREVRNEDHARLISYAPELQAYAEKRAAEGDEWAQKLIRSIV